MYVRTTLGFLYVRSPHLQTEIVLLFSFLIWMLFLFLALTRTSHTMIIRSEQISWYPYLFWSWWKAPSFSPLSLMLDLKFPEDVLCKGEEVLCFFCIYWNDHIFSPLLCIIVCYTNFQILSQPYISGTNFTWSWCIIFSICCSIYWECLHICSQAI